MGMLIDRRKGKAWRHLGEHEVGEVLCGIALIALISWCIPGSWLSSHLLFCAFFLVVSASAIRYHTATAYSAGGLAAISYSGLFWLHPEMRVQADIARFILEPFLLLVSGVVISDLSRIQRHRLSTLERQYMRTNDVLQATKRRYQTILTINEELERQVVGQSASISVVSEKIAGIWHLRGNECYNAILDMLIQAMGVQSCSIYVCNLPGQWCLVASQSISESKFALQLEADDPLVQRVLSTGQVSTIRDFLSEGQTLASQMAVMAGPLCDRAGEVVGIVMINTIPLLKFTPGSIRLFSALLRIASIPIQVQGEWAETTARP